jgi:hypothetical protein
MKGGRIPTVNMIHSAVLAGFCTLQLDLKMVYKLTYKSGFFICGYFVTGEDDRAVFLFPAIIFCSHNV